MPLYCQHQCQLLWQCSAVREAAAQQWQCCVSLHRALLEPSQPQSTSSAAAATAPVAPGGKAVGGGADAEGADEPGKRKKYQVRPKPLLESKFRQEQASATPRQASILHPAGQQMLMPQCQLRHHHRQEACSCR